MEIRRLSSDELQHHGVKGQRWGVRRYQNPDGSLTADGKAHYNKTYSKDVNRLKKKEKRYNKLNLKSNKRQMKADKFRDKEYRARTDSGAESYKSKSFRQQRKASRLKYKATKTYNSGLSTIRRWKRSMLKFQCRLLIKKISHMERSMLREFYIRGNAYDCEKN